MAMHTEGILPPAIRASNIRHWVSNPSYLKSADWQMLTGAIGMYLLHGLMGEEQQKAIFGFLSLAAQLTSRRIRRDALSDLPRQAVRVIAEMERVLPVCESGILRHMLIHVAERAQVGGPPWTHAMWPWERLWGRLVSWLHQGNNPAVSIMNSYLAFSVSRARLVLVCWLLPKGLAMLQHQRLSCIISHDILSLLCSLRCTTWLVPNSVAIMHFQRAELCRPTLLFMHLSLAKSQLSSRYA